MADPKDPAKKNIPPEPGIPPGQLKPEITGLIEIDPVNALNQAADAVRAGINTAEDKLSELPTEVAVVASPEDKAVLQRLIDQGRITAMQARADVAAAASPAVELETELIIVEPKSLSNAIAELVKFDELNASQITTMRSLLQELAFEEPIVHTPDSTDKKKLLKIVIDISQQLDREEEIKDAIRRGYEQALSWASNVDTERATWQAALGSDVDDYLVPELDTKQIENLENDEIETERVNNIDSTSLPEPHSIATKLDDLSPGLESIDVLSQELILEGDVIVDLSIIGLPPVIYSGFERVGDTVKLMFKHGNKYKYEVQLKHSNRSGEPKLVAADFWGVEGGFFPCTFNSTMELAAIWKVFLQDRPNAINETAGRLGVTPDKIVLNDQGDGYRVLESFELPTEQNAEQTVQSEDMETEPSEKQEWREKIDTGESRQVIFEKGRYTHPSEVLERDREIHITTSIGTIDGRCDYGGPASKYSYENQDTMFAGETPTRALIAGVIDGAGGSNNGLGASRIANITIERKLQEGVSVNDALKEANTAVYNSYQGSSYACCAIVKIETTGNTEVGWSGDAKIITIRNGKILRDATSIPDNVATAAIERAGATAGQYFIHPNNNVILSSTGRERNHNEDNALEFKAQEDDFIIVGSDGAITDLVSEYEIEQLAITSNGDTAKLQREIFDLAFSRANSVVDFQIKWGPGDNDIVNMDATRYGFAEDQWGYRKHGDNITVQVIKVERLGEQAFEEQPTVQAETIQVTPENELTLTDLGVFDAESQTFTLATGIDIAMSIPNLPACELLVLNRSSDNLKIQFRYNDDYHIVCRLSEDGSLIVTGADGTARLFMRSGNITDFASFMDEILAHIKQESDNSRKVISLRALPGLTKYDKTTQQVIFKNGAVVDMGIDGLTDCEITRESAIDDLDIVKFSYGDELTIVCELTKDEAQLTVHDGTNVPFKKIGPIDGWDKLLKEAVVDVMDAAESEQETHVGVVAGDRKLPPITMPNPNRGEAVPVKSTTPDTNIRDLLNEFKLRQQTADVDSFNRELAQARYVRIEALQANDALLQNINNLIEEVISIGVSNAQEHPGIDQIATELGIPVDKVLLVLQRQSERIHQQAKQLEKSNRSWKKGLLKAAGYIGAGVGIAATGWIPGAQIAGVMLGTRLVDNLLTDRSRRNNIIAKERSLREMLRLEDSDFFQKVREDLLAELASTKQQQIDNRDDELAFGYTTISEARDKYLDSTGNRKQIERNDLAEVINMERDAYRGRMIDSMMLEQAPTIYQAYQDARTGYAIGDILRDELATAKEAYYEKVKVLGIEQMANAAAALYSLDQNSLTLEREAERERKPKWLSKCMAFLTENKLVRGGETLTDKNIATTAYTTIAVLAREMPILRNVLGGIAGMRAADLVRGFATRGSESGRLYPSNIALIDRLREASENISVSRMDKIDVARARSRIKQAEYLGLSPTERQVLIEAVDVYDQALLLHAQNALSEVSSATKLLEEELQNSLATANRRRTTATITKAVGFTIGAMIPELVHSFNGQESIANTDTPADIIAPAPHSEINIETDLSTGTEPAPQPNIVDTDTPSEDVLTGTKPAIAEVVKPITIPGIGSFTDEEWGNMTIKAGEGVSHPLTRQLEARADEFGFSGEGDVHKWALRMTKPILLAQEKIHIDGKDVSIWSEDSNEQLWVMDKDKYSVVLSGTAENPIILLYDTATHEALNQSALDSALEAMPAKLTQAIEDLAQMESITTEYPGFKPGMTEADYITAYQEARPEVDPASLETAARIEFAEASRELNGALGIIPEGEPDIYYTPGSSFTDYRLSLFREGVPTSEVMSNVDFYREQWERAVAAHESK
ncbi:MAG: hypothetical protein Q8P90_02350 [bacterium]|nr:hypothetical protein [bacterium]